MILESKWAEVPHGNVVAWGTLAQNIFRANGLKFPGHVSLGELRLICFKEPKKHVCQRNLSPFAMGNNVSLGELGHIPQAITYSPGTWPIFPWEPFSPKELGPIGLGEANVSPLVLREKGETWLSPLLIREVVSCLGITSSFHSSMEKITNWKKESKLGPSA